LLPLNLFTELTNDPVKYPEQYAYRIHYAKEKETTFYKPTLKN